MNKNEFVESFRPLANIHYNSEKKVIDACSIYYGHVQRFSKDTFHEAMLRLQYNYENIFPSIQDVVKACTEISHIKHDKRFESEAEYQKRCNTPDAKKAKQDFYNKIAELSNRDYQKRDSHLSMWCHIANELITEPTEKQKVWEENNG